MNKFIVKLLEYMRIYDYQFEDWSLDQISKKCCWILGGADFKYKLF